MAPHVTSKLVGGAFACPSLPLHLTTTCVGKYHRGCDKAAWESLTGSWAPSLVTRPYQGLKGLILVGKALCLSQSTEPLIAVWLWAACKALLELPRVSQNCWKESVKAHAN